MAVSVVSTDPANNSVDYPINKDIQVVFDKEIDSATLTENVVSLIDDYTRTPVPISLNVNQLDKTQVFISPDEALKEDTKYSILIIGTDQGLGFSLDATDGDSVATTQRFYFTTGDKVYSIDETLEKQVSSVTQEGDLFLPANVEALGYEFTISSVSPANHSHGVATTLNGSNQVVFTFSKPLATGQDYSTWASVEAYPLLDTTEYLADDTGLDLGSGRVTIPSHSISVSGSNLIVTFNDTLPKNLGIYIELNSNIKSTVNDQYGGSLTYNVNTQLYPTLSGPHSVRREIQAFQAELFDSYVGSLIFKNSMYIWERAGRPDLTTYSFPFHKYVLFSTVIDLIENKDLEKAIIAGTRRQLGDLSASVDLLAGRVALKLARAEKEKENSFETIFKGRQVRTGIYSAYLEAAASVSRLWYDVSYRYTSPEMKYRQTNEPIANTSYNRQAKTNNPRIL